LDINLAWTTSSGAENYTLYRHTSQITSGNLNCATEVKTITGLNTTDTVPGPGRWYYAVVTNNEVGSSDPSNSPYIDVQEPSSQDIPVVIPVLITLASVFGGEAVIGIAIVLLKKKKRSKLT